jgi:hypothetical protein
LRGLQPLARHRVTGQTLRAGDAGGLTHHAMPRSPKRCACDRCQSRGEKWTNRALTSSS